MCRHGQRKEEEGGELSSPRCKNPLIKVSAELNQEEGGVRGAKQKPSVAMDWDKVKVTLE